MNIYELKGLSFGSTQSSIYISTEKDKKAAKGQQIKLLHILKTLGPRFWVHYTTKHCTEVHCTALH